MRILFELRGKDPEIRFSPFVWAARLALLHKDLAFGSDYSVFLDKSRYADSGSTALPVLKDGETWVPDSLEIAKYLERTYPEKPLFGGPIGYAQAGMQQTFVLMHVMRPLFPMVAADVHDVLDEENAAYFRKTRQERLPDTLEACRARRDEALPAFQAGLAPLKAGLGEQAFMGGEGPSWLDYITFGAFQWVRVVSDFEPLAGDEQLIAWRERMLDLYDGDARKAKCAR